MWRFFKSYSLMNQSETQNHRSMTNINKLKDKDATLVFNFEDALLKSSFLFPYFMLVAYEAGGPARALVLLLLYPVISIVGREMGLKIMVFVSFVGLEKRKFRLGTTVLPKFYLEDIGVKVLDVVMSCKRKVGVTELPAVMVEPFLKDFLGVDDVVGRQLKVVNGYYVGLMEERKGDGGVRGVCLHHLTQFGSYLIGFGSLNSSFDPEVLSLCKEVYLVSEAEKRGWQALPREKYPKPLIFHDGRLAFNPTPLHTLAMFMWLPLGFFLLIVRVGVALTFPLYVSIPIVAFTGLRHTFSISAKRSNDNNNNQQIESKPTRNAIYVCNHRNVLDAFYVALAMKKHMSMSAVTYSISTITELVSPIKLFRLTRDREKDEQLMHSMLSRSDIVICAEGTTCREPYLLRFSPLFAEVSDNIVPVAVRLEVPMFHGSTAGGNKGLDVFYHYLNPTPSYSVEVLGRVPVEYTCKGGGKSSVEVANYVQKEIATALGFECTSLSRKDKYMTLAGSDGTVKS